MKINIFSAESKIEIKKIEYNNQAGYFISEDYFKEVRLVVSELQFLQKRYELLEENFNNLDIVYKSVKKQLKLSFVKNISLAVLTGITIVTTIIAIVIPCVMYVRFQF